MAPLAPVARNRSPALPLEGQLAAIIHRLRMHAEERCGVLNKAAAPAAGAAWKTSLAAALGKTRRYGLIEEIEETSASFEVRSAFRSYDFIFFTGCAYQ